MKAAIIAFSIAAFLFINCSPTQAQSCRTRSGKLAVRVVGADGHEAIKKESLIGCFILHSAGEPRVLCYAPDRHFDDPNSTSSCGGCLSFTSDAEVPFRGQNISCVMECSKAAWAAKKTAYCGK